MDIFLSVLAVLCALAGFLGCILPVLPGPPVSYLGLLLVSWSGYGSFSGGFLLAWAAVTIAVTVLDYVLPVWMTKKMGGSKQASWGAAAGIVAGLFFLPAGLIIGPFLGALVGEMMHEGGSSPKAFKVALGSFLAFFLGTGLKLIACGAMAFYIIRDIFW